MSLKSEFLAFDRRLAKHGVPPLTRWWRTGIGAWLDAYENGGVLELWGCVGRGAAKSTALYKLALFFTLFGKFEVPAGERHFAIVLSRLKEEAAKGIAIIAAWLRLLGVTHHPAGDVIELEGQPRGIRVVAASVAATSGWRSFFVGKDERSKWPSDGATELDAEEIDTSAAAMTATHALAPVVSFGSAWGAFGPFYDAIVSGSDDRHMVLGPTPTWIAAPHITEESTRRKEKDERRWAREYRCEFQAAGLACFDPEAVDRAFGRTDIDVAKLGAAILVLDPSSGRKDTWSWGVVQKIRTNDDRELVRFSLVDGLEGRFWKQTSGDQVVDRLAALAHDKGIDRVCSDQRESLMLEAAFRRHGLRFTAYDWTSASKPPAVERVRRWFADNALDLPTHERLRRELHSFEERIAPSGAFTFGARGSGHDDFVSLLITAAMVELEGDMRTPRKSSDGFVGGYFPGTSIDDLSAGFGDVGRNN